MDRDNEWQFWEVPPDPWTRIILVTDGINHDLRNEPLQIFGGPGQCQYVSRSWRWLQFLSPIFTDSPQRLENKLTIPQWMGSAPEQDSSPLPKGRHVVVYLFRLFGPQL
jgi:hypothetical protein